MGFVHNFGKNKIELNLGGKQWQYLNTFERFVTRLIETGANLLFVCDGQLQPNRMNVWCQRRNTEYFESIGCIEGSTTENVVARTFLKRRFGCKAIAKSLNKLIEDKKYGNVIVSTQIDCDLAIAQHATERSVLAVITSDSDFLIFDGPFQWWHSNSMDMDNMTVNYFDRIELLKLLNVSREEMIYLATIAGNDHTSCLVRKPPNFIEIAEFCRSLDKSSETIHEDIVQYMQIDNRMSRNEAIECVTKSIESYDLNAIVEPTESTEMDKYCANNEMMFAFRNQQVFQYPMNFVDFKHRNFRRHNYHPFAYTLLDTFRKLAGIMLKNVDHRDATLKIVTKYAFGEEYKLRLLTPIYPRGTKTML